jgi:hypothetical protein
MLKALPAIGPTETTIQDYENAVAGFLQQLRVLIPARWFEQMEACRRSGQQVISDQDATPKDRTEETALRRPKDPSTGNKSNPAKRRARAPSTGVRQGVVGDVVKASVSERSAPAGAIAQ